MAAIPPVLAATAPAPENFRSLRRSIRVMVFPPYHPEAFRCIGGSLKPTAAWRKPAPPIWWGRRLKGQVELLGFSPLWLGVLRRSTFERVDSNLRSLDGMRPRKSGSQQTPRAGGRRIRTLAPLSRGSHFFSRTRRPEVDYDGLVGPVLLGGGPSVRIRFPPAASL